jgi:peptidoglycan/xylan/chitin deacetylase (PgdA/CDA1 family)
MFVAPGLLECFPPWDLLAQASRWSDAERHTFLWRDRGNREVTFTQEFARGMGEQLRIANASRVAALATLPGVAIGNHTFGHPNLGALAADEVVTQLQHAGRVLKDLVGAAYIPVLAYPFGIAPQSPRDTLPLASISFGLRVAGGWCTQGMARDAFQVSRLNVPAGMPTAGFRRCVRGWTS